MTSPGAARGGNPEDPVAAFASDEAFAAALVESAPDAVLGVDIEGRLRMVNRQAEVIFGYSRAEMMGRPIEVLIPGRFAAAHVGHRSSYFQNRRTRSMGEGLELLGRRKDGTEFPVDVSLSAIETTAGPLAIAFVRDITQRKMAEEQLRLANRDLESFSHTISHDLRAPIRAMRGFSQALIEDYGPTLDATALDYLRRVDKAGASMERLVDDLLEFSRIGRQQVTTRAVNTGKVLDEVMAALQGSIQETQATVEVRKPLPAVTAEPQLLFQALLNLVSNALKYMVPGQRPKIQIAAEPQGDRVRISVEDNGIGIEAAHMDRIWKPFERLHGPNEYAGTGVGLAIVKRAVERMGGSAGVESWPGKGSKFWIELKRAAEAEK